MNPRKTFSQMNPEERTQFLDALTVEMNLPEFHPVKKAILEKVVQYAREQLVSTSLLKPSLARYAACDSIFDAKNMATLCFLEKTIQVLNEIPDTESKLRDAVLTDAIQRRAALIEKHANITTGFSIALMASSLVTDWSVAILLFAGGLSMYKYSHGLVTVRAAQAFQEQSTAPLLGHGPAQRLDGDFGDTIENISKAIVGGGHRFFSYSKQAFLQKYQQLNDGGAPANPAPRGIPGLQVIM